MPVAQPVQAVPVAQPVQAVPVAQPVQATGGTPDQVEVLNAIANKVRVTCFQFF